MIATARNMVATTHWAMRRIGSRSRSKTVGYIGGHGGGNLGDDLMGSVAQMMFPQWRFVDFAESWHEKRLARVGLSGQPFFRHVLLGGGTLISPFWFGKVEMAVNQGVGVSTLGTGAGSCGFIQRDGIGLANWAPLLKRFKHLGVRGPRSVARLEAIGVEHAQVVGDLALYLTRETPVEPDKTPTIAVNLSLPAGDEPQFGEAQRFEELITSLQPYVKKGWAIRPYAMNAIDVEPTQQLVKQLCGSPQPVPHLDSVEAFFDHVGPATLNIAVRLHGAILGCCAGVPPVMLGYRDKCLDFAESLELGSYCLYLPTAQPGDITKMTAAASEAATELRQQIITRALTMKQRLVDYAKNITEGSA